VSGLKSLPDGDPPTIDGLNGDLAPS